MTDQQIYDARIEAVKVALREAFARQKIDPWLSIDLGSVIPPFDWDGVARAADAAVLAAIEEPTKGMLKAAHHMRGYSLESEYIKEEYRAMIRAIPSGEKLKRELLSGIPRGGDK